MKPCPKCKLLLEKVLDKTTYHPTGSCGGGTWIFQTFDLYRCIACGEFFHDKGERICSEPLRV